MSEQNKDAERAVEAFVAELTKLGKCVISIDDLNALIADRAALQKARSLPVGVPDQNAPAPIKTPYLMFCLGSWWTCEERQLSAALDRNYPTLKLPPAPAAPTVKAEQAEGSLADAVRVLLEVPQLRGKQAHSAQPIIDRVRALLEAPSLPAAGSADLHAATDGELEAMAKRHGARWDGDAWVIEDADFHPFMRALSAQQAAPERVSVPVELAERLIDPYRREPRSIHLHNEDCDQLRDLLNGGGV